MKFFNVRSLVFFGIATTSALFSQPGPTPPLPDLLCKRESEVLAKDTVVSTFDTEGYRSLFDGKSFTGWWQSGQTPHSSNDRTLGAIWRVDTATRSIYSTQRGQNGGVLMTTNKFKNYELVFDIWPSFGDDGGIFNRTPENGSCYQTVLDYLGGAAFGGTWGENGNPAGDIRPFKFGGDAMSISDNGWKDFTSKLNPTSFGCQATGCTESDWQKLWNFNGWNQVKIQFYGGWAPNTGHVHMKSFFRKVSALSVPWVPIESDTNYDRVIEPNHIGIQVHGGGRFGGEFGNWYRNIKYRELSDNGIPATVGIKNSKEIYSEKKSEISLKANSISLSGKVELPHEILIEDVKGRFLESFKGTGGNVNYTFRNKSFGILNLTIKTVEGTKTLQIFRAK